MTIGGLTALTARRSRPCPTGVYRLEPIEAGDVARAREIIERHPDLELGLADASLVVLAERHDTAEILTLEELHFRAVLGSRGRRFPIRPVDE